MGFGELLKEPNTKAIYRFNGDLLADSSGNSMALLNTGVSLTNVGRFGQGADFGNTGNNWKYLYNNSNLNATLSNDITILFWVYPKSQPTAPNRRFIDYRTGTAYLLIDYWYYQSTYSLRALANGTDAIYNFQFTLNKWYFIAVTISTAGAMTLYLNGTQVATGTRGSSSVGNVFTLGNTLSPTNFNIGAIYDEVHVIQRLWSPVEIQKAYTYMKGMF